MKNIWIWCVLVSFGYGGFLRDSSNGIVLDTTTNLIWQDNTTVSKPWVTQENFDASNYNDTSGDTAIMYCENLSLAGFDDWRLPNIKELLSIVDKTKSTPFINNVFQNIFLDFYWSSSSQLDSSNSALGVHFASITGTYKTAKNYSKYVRCIRDGQ